MSAWEGSVREAQIRADAEAHARTRDPNRATPRPLAVIEEELRHRLEVLDKELAQYEELKRERAIIAAMLSVKV